MTRAVICGDQLEEAATTLALERVRDRPDVVLLDLSDPEAVSAAADLDPLVPRVVIGGAEHLRLVRALGRGAFELASSPEPAAIGPLVARLAPLRPRPATRLVLVTGVAGGCGRTLLAVNLAVRLATRGSVALLDLTGSGAAAWWLRVGASPWSEMEGMTAELTPEHLAVVASGREGLRVVGGAGPMPSGELAVAATRAALGLADVVIADAPHLRDDRTRAVSALADRILVVASADPASRATLEGVPSDGHWIVASRSENELLAGHNVLRSLPDDTSAVRSAAAGDGTVRGKLGRAYDDLADLLAIDATAP